MSVTLDLLEKKAEERYYKEHERNAQINNSLSIPIGIIVALLGAVGFFLLSIPFKIINTPVAWIVLVFFVASLLVLVCCLFLAVYFLRKVFIGLRYAYIPNPRPMCNYAKRLEKYFESQQAKNIDETVAGEVREFMVDAYCRSTDNNIKKNVEKGFY